MCSGLLLPKLWLRNFMENPQPWQEFYDMYVPGVLHCQVNPRPGRAPCHQSWLWPTGTRTSAPVESTWGKDGHGYSDIGWSFCINIPRYNPILWAKPIYINLTIMGYRKIIWGKCWWLALRCVYYASVHAQTEREREREWPGGKRVQHWVATYVLLTYAPRCFTLCPGVIRFLHLIWAALGLFPMRSWWKNISPTGNVGGNSA